LAVVSVSLQGDSDNQTMDYFQKAQVPGEGFVATAKIKHSQSIKQAVKAFRKKCVMLSPPIRHFIWENMIYTLDGKDVSCKILQA